MFAVINIDVRTLAGELSWSHPLFQLWADWVENRFSLTVSSINLSIEYYANLSIKVAGATLSLSWLNSCRYHCSEFFNQQAGDSKICRTLLANDVLNCNVHDRFLWFGREEYLLYGPGKGYTKIVCRMMTYLQTCLGARGWFESGPLSEHLLRGNYCK